MKNASEIKFNSITKETEKAICINVMVSWGDGNAKTKDVWFPKSTCEVIGSNSIMVADWMIEKTCNANAFHGYTMGFMMCSNGRFAN